MRSRIASERLICVQDMYTYAFLTSLDYTANCYSCQYATLSRVSDITIGDSWGSDRPDSEQKRHLIDFMSDE